jgi:hypothetical protein
MAEKPELPWSLSEKAVLNSQKVVSNTTVFFSGDRNI